nr:MAG TPA: hypothetical protein [Caudoviricetes sp.]
MCGHRRVAKIFVPSFIASFIVNFCIHIHYRIRDNMEQDDHIELHVDLQSSFLDEVYVVDENIGHSLAPIGILDSRTRQHLDFYSEHHTDCLLQHRMSYVEISVFTRPPVSSDLHRALLRICQ